MKEISVLTNKVLISEVVKPSKKNWKSLKRELKRKYISVKHPYGTFSVQKEDIISYGETEQELRDAHSEHFV